MSKISKLMIKFLVFTLLFLYPLSNLFSQKNLSSDFVSPLNIPLFLSGNYGELRTDHFHAGIDIKTQSVIGKPVFAADEGYVSRIKIQSGGYGNALYITHPNGYTSVYGHLDRFIPEIQEYIESKQYEKQKFEIELFPGKAQFIVNQGQVIAYSGNTGRSGGPHLHFEIRKSNGQVPLNALKFNFPVADNRPPVFRNLYVYLLSEDNPVGNSNDIRQEYNVIRRNDTTFQVNNVISLFGNFTGLGVEVYDYLNGSPNRCGVYRTNFYLDGQFQYGFTIDAISFPNTRYINAHMDYALKLNEGKSVHRLHAMPNNRLRIYRNSEGNGIFSLTDDSVHLVRVEAYDVYGNKSVLHAKVQKENRRDDIPIKTEQERVHWFEGGIFQTGPFRISIAPSSLYNDIHLDLNYENANSLLEDTLIIHSPDEPLHKSMTIRVVLDSVALRHKDKLLFARINEENEIESEDGECIDSKLITSTRNFGKYIVIVDTVKPEIVPITFISGRKYTAGQKLKFTVSDALAGLYSYNGFIDDQWILLKYDAKSDTMEYTIDEDRIIAGKIHDLRIEVRDEVGNIAIFTGQFFY